MRLSTAMTPRVIACAEELPKHIALPRGCRAALEELLGVHGVVLDVVDERVAGAPLQLQFQGNLTEVQESAAKALLAHDTGVFVAPPGVGKTVVGAYLVASRACSTLILVHRRPLLDQWLAQLALPTSSWASSSSLRSASAPTRPKLARNAPHLPRREDHAASAAGRLLCRPQ